MTSQNFDRSLRLVLAHEGGYVDHPRDPGGATNMGITRGTLSIWLGRSATKSDVRHLTVQTAGRIYRANYWAPVSGDDLPAGLDYVVFDAAVNSGPKRSVKWLQGALGFAGRDLDGAMGNKTLAAALNASDRAGVIRRACAVRRGFLQSLKNWKTFGRGWGRRVAEVEIEALSMVAQKPLTIIAASQKEATATVQRNTAGAGGIGGGAATFANIDALPPSLLAVVLGAGGLMVAILLVRAWHGDTRRRAAKNKLMEISRG